MVIALEFANIRIHGVRRPGWCTAIVSNSNRGSLMSIRLKLNVTRSFNIKMVF